MSNAKIPNPYESPQPDRIWSWWDLLRQWFPGLFPQPVTEASLPERLLQGRRVFVYGVVLQLPPTDPEILRASLPLAVAEEELAQRNIDEVRRVLGKLLHQHADLQPLVNYRRLEIWHVADYSSTSQPLRSDVFPPGDWLLAALDDDLEWEIADPTEEIGRGEF